MPRASTLNVVVADDQLTIRALVKSGLASIGIDTIRMAIDGEQALDALRSEPADLVLTDVNMPKLDGLGLLREIRADPALKSIPVIMLTGVADKQVVQQALALKVNNFVVKPFSNDKLKEKIEAVLGHLTQ